MRITLVSIALACAFPLGAYQYYYTDNLTSIDTSKWHVNHNGVAPAANPGGLSSIYEASLISRLPVPDGSSEYEVRGTYTWLMTELPHFFQYVRATPNALYHAGLNFGSYYVLMIRAERFNANGCEAWLQFTKQVGPVRTTLVGMFVPCFNGMQVRTVAKSTGILVKSDAGFSFFVADTELTSGAPGIGIYNMQYGNYFRRVELGPLDRTPPQPVDPGTISVYPLPWQVEATWGQANDGDGTGVADYHIYRNSVEIAAPTDTNFEDLAASPNTAYSYLIYATDQHGNWSAPTPVQATTPPPGVIDSRRVGVRPTGAYWGGAGEQIDTLSGNLNYSATILTAKGRGGWGVPFALSYNSQIWRQSPSATRKLGADVGYGFGWRLMAGAVMPYWSGTQVHHYRYTDATGAEYRLDVNNNGIWTSKEAVYLDYEEATRRLYFPDGSFWAMEALSQGAEADAGTRYPTLMQDTNGNQIRIRYHPGKNAWVDDTSARIKFIEDVRAVWFGGVWQSYTFTYTPDIVPRLTLVENQLGSGEGAQFTYLHGRPLQSPFSPSVSFGVTTLLGSVRNPYSNLTHSFGYANDSAELNHVDLPHGGRISWTYRSYTNSLSRTVREVDSRALQQTQGAAATSHEFWRDPGDSALPAHTQLIVRDGIAQKKWSFHGTGANAGQVLSYEEGAPNWASPKRQHAYSWTQDATGNPYIASVLTTVDPATQYQKQMKTEQTVDTHGNITQTKIYDWNSLATPARTYTHTYLTGAVYASRHIWNRLAGTSVTGGGQTVQLLTQTYDTPDVNYHGTAGIRQHDPAYNHQFFTRGNVRRRTVPGKTIKFEYDIGGNVRVTSDDYGHQATATATANYAAPGLITPNNNSGLSTSLSYNSFLGLTQESGPNGSTAYLGWDGSGRPTSSTSPDGAVTTYGYTNLPSTISAATNGRWIKTTFDGVGRPAKVEQGDGSGTKSVVDTEYAPCACSPLGKVSRVSQPYVPGATIYWTTYTYDSLGRTVSVSHPGNSGTTTYLYEGNTVKVTDPAGKWKKLSVDALGNLTQATEPNPAGGP